jgi:Toprim-like
MERFRIGVVVEPEPGHEHLKGWMCIPYLTVSGPVHLKFRCLENHRCKDHGHPKYMGPASDAGRVEKGAPKAWLFNAQAVLTAEDWIVITEGELDAVAVETLADMPAVAQPGSTIWAKVPYWPRVFDGLKPIVLADGDRAGREAAQQVAASLWDARVVQMPEGEDANSFLVTYGVDEFYRRLGV